MGFSKQFLAGLGLGFAILTGAASGSDFEPPNSQIGNADWSGGLERWVEIGQIALGNGENLPLRLRFSSGKEQPEPLAGKSWWCPLLESAAEHAEPHCLEFTTLGGGLRFLVRTGVTEFLALNGRASGHADGNGGWGIESEGWRYHYRDGRLAKAESPGGRSLTWTYDSEGAVFLRDERGRILVSAKRKDDAWEMEGMFGKFVSRRTGTDGKEKEGWLLSFPNGRQERLVTEADGEDVLKMTVSSAGWKDQIFCWRASTGGLLSDGDFTYETRATDEGVNLLHRIDRKGRTEWYLFDTTKGRAVYKRQDGSRVVSWYHTEPGPVYRKVFRMDTLSEKQDRISSRLVEYDGEGEITAEWTESGAALFAQQASPRYIDLEEALRLKDRTEVLFVDARTSAEFLHGHIPGAVRVGRTTFDKDYLENGDRLRVARKLVIYCSSRQCEDSSIVATKLSQLGHRDILIFEGGWAEWWKRNR